MITSASATPILGAYCAAVLLAGCSGGPSTSTPSLRNQMERPGTHVRYSISPLPGISRTSWTSADGINNRGWITGWATLSGNNNPEHEMLWVGKRKFDFGTLGGPSSASEFAKKGNTNDVPGESETSTEDPLGEDFCYFGTGYTCLGTDWRDGDLDALPILGGNNGIAIGNNDRGQIVGVSETNTKDSQCVAPQVLDFEAALWEPHSHRVKELRPLSGDTVGVATAINDGGDVVGGSGPNCATLTPALGVHPLLWKRGSPILLPTLGGTMNNIPWMINQRGEMAGMANVAGNTTTHAVLWRNPKEITDLGTLPGDTSSLAGSMNDSDQLVGQSCDASGNCRGFIWQDGVMTDLNTLISGGSRYFVVTANDVNDDGIIVGQALDKKTGKGLAFVATPHYDNNAPPMPAVKLALPQFLRDRLAPHGFAEPARRSQPSTGPLNGESLSSDDVIVTGHHCDRNDYQVSFAAAGDAAGPHPGTFTAQGSWKAHWIGNGGEHWAFEERFTIISSGSPSISGTIHGGGNVWFKDISCYKFPAESLTYKLPDGGGVGTVSTTGIGYDYLYESFQ